MIRRFWKTAVLLLCCSFNQIQKPLRFGLTVSRTSKHPEFVLFSNFRLTVLR
ncbi:hypothetical protein KC19_4G166900 [Ceratodon purpureus]|uniref:Uncharacterized protein n=1 Tax=Ceratodon purpureus TaxID=3225 RepID=A0A8T0ID19_CERPU|nr:hypothetical protein KC19_4G166900 [Ceratodon purpureus]